MPPSIFYLAHPSLNKGCLGATDKMGMQEEVNEAKQKSRDRVTAWANVLRYNEWSLLLI